MKDEQGDDEGLTWHGDASTALGSPRLVGLRYRGEITLGIELGSLDVAEPP